MSNPVGRQSNSMSISTSDNSDNSDNDETKCAICLEYINDQKYATTDHPDDAQTKCCPPCLKEMFKKSNKSLISRVPVNSYTIYSAIGQVLEKIIVHQQEDQGRIEVPDIIIIIPHNEDQQNHPNINIYNIQLPQHIVPVHDRWKKWRRLNAIIVASIFVCGLILFGAFKGADIFPGISSYIALFVSSGSVMVGIIIHGLLECQKAVHS